MSGRKWLSPINAVVWTQFLSAFADNLNFFLIVGMVNRAGGANPDGTVAYIQIAFLLAYVVLAPVVGAFADKKSKSRVLLIGNLLKGTGIALLLFGLPPAICYVFVGIGAVVYSPAKYGILSELTNSESELLKANAKIEGTTILAILLGTVVGGILAQNSDLPAILTCLGIYALSLMLTFAVPVRGGNPSIRYGESAKQFLRDTAALFRLRRARFSLIGTASFWLTASVLRIALVAWLPVNLGITDTRDQSLIIGVTAVGVVVSALLTPVLVPAGKLHRAYYYGIFMVLCVMVASLVPSLWFTVSLLFVIGILGGIFLIPLNTMLQEEGRDAIGSGKTIAVQNFTEQALTVFGLTIYLAMSEAKVPINLSVIGIGIVLLLFILYLATQIGRVQAAARRGEAGARFG
ncbi:lysophospholipid transporter LplT [Cohnella sp. CFH 77786]|uniref:lysophospholipid transporter LplT n=1 Tax=Cohnella sp. CFH 77786 TaxID=2662265 RepID=UPI001C60CA31|nr:lysophospholipid transporter LplT [Cohnella sp. CFH 77786]MBW5447995.1 lysophospholipid transporter LplT [Cohnella sp. CFH 77786]